MNNQPSIAEAFLNHANVSTVFNRKLFAFGIYNPINVQVTAIHNKQFLTFSCTWSSKNTFSSLIQSQK